MAQFFRIIDEQADRMDSLIGDLLDAGRIDTGTLSVAPEPSDVAVLVDQARGTFISGGGRAHRPHRPAAGPVRPAVPQVHHRRGPGGRQRAGPRHLQGPGRGPGRAHPGRERRRRPRRALHLHDPGGRGGQRQSRPSQPGHAPDAVPILVVDDDPETLRHLRDTLAEAGYAPLVTGDPGAVARIIRAEKPQLVLLDLMLPGTDGIELMQTVPELSDLPVIFISGYGRDETIARALEAGAEDYVVKPVSPTELTARIRAALRRRSNPVPFVLGELAIDYDRRRVSVTGRPVTLTPTEYELLRVLAQGAGRVLTHEALLRQVWARRGKANPKIVRAYVKRLRHRLGDDAARPAWIVNERGVGYRMARPGEPCAGRRQNVIRHVTRRRKRRSTQGAAPPSGKAPSCSYTAPMDGYVTVTATATIRSRRGTGSTDGSLPQALDWDRGQGIAPGARIITDNSS